MNDEPGNSCAREPMSAFHDPEIYRSILECLPTGLCVIDMEKRILLWSDGAERITGHLRHEVVGHSCVGDTILHCNQPDCESCNDDGPLARAIKTARPTEATGFLHHKRGHEVPVRVRAVPVHNAHGSIVGAIETFEEQLPCASPDHHEDGLTLPGFVDEITGVANQLMMQSHLRQTMLAFTEVQVPFCLLSVRVEGFDHFRASFGTEAAFTLLRMIARTLETALLKTDFVGRWSDDQFLVILNGCNEGALPTVRERIGRMLANDGIEWWGERRSLPVRIGHATAQSGDGVESILERTQKSLEAVSPSRSLAASATGNKTSGV
jgi:diguanylate cyclase (GGDEF)-like protein/PAS domain S-box-containing protein